MTPDDTIRLCRMVKAVCPSQAYDQYTPDAWHLILGHLRYDDCRAAVAHLAGLDLEPGKARYIEPGHIVAQVKRIRAKRLDDYGPVDPPSGLDPTAYLGWLRSTQSAIADGNPPERPAIIRANPAHMAALMAGVAKSLPTIEEQTP